MKWRVRIIKGALIAAGVVLLGLIQAGFFDRLKIMNCKPELVLCFVAVLAVRARSLRAGLTGFLAGLYIDIVYGRYVGIYALLYLVFCVLVSVSLRRLTDKYKWAGLPLLPPLFLLYEMAESLLVRFVAVYVAGGGPLYHYPYAEHFRVRILPGAAYNLAVALVFYLILLLAALIRRPKPAIRYQRDKDIVIDNA